MGAKQTRSADGLTDLERRFAIEYLVDFNATQAYMRASPRKVSARTAEANGYKLLQRPEIQQLVKAQRDKLTTKAELSVEDVLNKLRALMMFDVRHLFGADGSPLPITELPDDVAAAIAGLEVAEIYEGSGDARVFVGHLKKYKLINRVDVLEKAMKYHGLFSIDNRQRTDPVTELLSHIYANNGSRITPKQG